jgi:hypothetical protein
MIGVSRRTALTSFWASDGFMFQPCANGFLLARKPAPDWLTRHGAARQTATDRRLRWHADCSKVGK